MTEGTTVMTRKGQITVPVEIRRALGLQEGDRVVVALEGEGRATLQRVESVADRTYGMLSGRPRPGDDRELRRLFIEETGRNAAAEGLPDDES